MNIFPGRLAIQQRVLPSYRAPFFDLLALSCTGGLSVYAGNPLRDEQISSTIKLGKAQFVSARNLHLMNLDSALYQCWQIGIIRWLEKWQPDALIVEANPRYPSNRSAIRWMHERHRPVLGWGLGAPPINGFLSSWRRKARLSFLKSLDAIIAYSNRGSEEYRSLGISEHAVYVALNSVAPRPLAPPPDRPTEFLGIPKVLYVGRLQVRKNIDNLLYACSALKRSLQPTLWIIGDGPARSEFQSIANQVFPQAEFLGGVYGDELKRYFLDADIFVLPGTGGLAVQQAMTFGLPVIVAEGDGTQVDLVRPNNGWLIASNDVTALTQALDDALSDPVSLRSMGKASYHRVLEEVNIETMVDVFIQALSRVIYKPNENNN
jgi:glycosyltransferase involved in cell wall biosynthesis